MLENQSCVFCWSGGKDSALALHKVLTNKHEPLNVDYLLTTLSEQYKRISMHGVRQKLLQEQARQIDIPLKEIFLPENASMKEYDRLMHTTWEQFKEVGIETAIFGDIFLEDLKKYREDQLGKVGCKAHFPLWKIDTLTLAQEFIGLGFKSITVSVDTTKLDASFVGRIIDEQFLDDLPEDVDPCGENGEFHSFVFDGPIFSKPVTYSLGEKVYKTYPLNTQDGKTEKGFWFMDLIPSSNG